MTGPIKNKTDSIGACLAFTLVCVHVFKKWSRKAPAHTHSNTRTRSQKHFLIFTAMKENELLESVS